MDVQQETTEYSGDLNIKSSMYVDFLSKLLSTFVMSFYLQLKKQMRVAVGNLSG